jgi:hypothetical protein
MLTQLPPFKIPCTHHHHLQRRLRCRMAQQGPPATPVSADPGAKRRQWLEIQARARKVDVAEFERVCDERHDALVAAFAAINKRVSFARCVLYCVTCSQRFCVHALHALLVFDIKKVTHTHTHTHTHTLPLSLSLSLSLLFGVEFIPIQPIASALCPCCTARQC